MRFSIPNSPKEYTKRISDFLGVDYTSVLPNERRSTRLINMINNNGYLETRPGYDTIGYEFGKAASLSTNFTDINSNITFTSIRKSEKSNDISISFVKPDKNNQELKLLIEDKHLIFSLSTDENGNIITTAAEIAALENTLVTFHLEGDDTGVVEELEETNLSGGESYRINGIWNVDKQGQNVFVVHVKNKLYLLDSSFNNPEEIEMAEQLNDNISQAVYLNNKLVIFDGKRVIAYGEFGNTWKANYIDEIGYVPTTIIGRNPDGTGGTTYEDINLIQPYRINSFLANGTTDKYFVEAPFDDEKPTATIINSSGEVQELTVESYNHLTGEVKFTTIPPAFPVVGRDSVFIRFKVTNEETINYINKSTIVTTFGYNGNNNRLFVTGNSDFPNVDWFSEVDDPTYFPAQNYTRIGFEPIQSYLRLNDGTLAILKKTSDTDATVYYRKSMIYNGQEVFPIASGVKSIGNISKYANANLLNDPLTLCELGVYSIVGSEYQEKFAMERSYFIKNKLLKEENLENAIAIVFRDKYYLAINNNVYIADARYATRVKDSNSDFQYEWYYWENIPVRVWLTYNNELYFCTEDGDICKFDNNSCYDYNVPIYQSFDTSFLDLGSITSAKTIKRVTVISKPDEHNEFTLSYLTQDEVNDIITSNFDYTDFPHTLQEKEKIKKFMFVKFRLSSNKPKKMNFYQIAIDFVLAGHYRGE